MRLHRLELEGIGPFRQRQVIDFDRVSAQGLFLIDGPTGAGKTTIIDAIVYALYGRVSAADSDETRMRSNFLDDDQASSIVCEFSVDGRRHRIERILPLIRPPKRGSGKPVSVPEKRVLTELDSSGAVVVELTKEREVAEHLQHLLGLDADQFRKLVVLPQGEFAALLRMAPTDRGRVLEPLLGDGLYRRIQEGLETEGQRARAARAEADQAVTEAAQRLAGALDAYRDWDAFPDDTDLRDANASDDGRLAVAQAAADWIVDQRQQARSAQVDAAAVLHQAQQLLEALAASLVARAEVDRARSDAETARHRLDDADRDLSSEQLASVTAALERTIGESAELVRWEREGDVRVAARRQLADAVDDAARAHAACVDEFDELPGRIEAAEQALQDLRELAQPGEALDLHLSSLVDRLDLARQAEQQRAELVVLDEQWTRARDELDCAQARHGASADALDRLIEQQRAERAALLASVLAEHEPCPVCGSVVHPNPARAASSEEIVADADLDAGRAEVASTQAALQRATSAEQDARARHEIAMARIADLDDRLDGVDVAAAEAAVATAREQREQARRAREAMDVAQQEVRSLRERQQTIGDMLRDLGQALTAARMRLMQFDDDDARMRDRIRQLVGDERTVMRFVADLEQRVARVRDLDRALHDVRVAEAALAPAVRDTDVETLTALHDEAERECAELQQRHAAASERYAQLVGAEQAVGPLRAELVEAIEAKGAAHGATARAIDLGEIAGGGRGNLRRLPLRAYALQLRFQSVLDAASRHLERMSNGKFSLELKEEARQGYAGLGIWIRDSWSGGLREPKTLSGGETFYASLSLALGLAEVVQAEVGGRTLETLFVDEGFGSLDADTLDKVLDQLDRLRSGGRVVGVVSHVSEMKDAIADRVDVRVQPDRTSAITMVC